jgi:uncharacterized damage-inducible protein DinB
MLGTLFRDDTVEKLTQEAGRIADCLGKLSEEQIWARPNESSNSVGNLVLHLCGNMRQWIGHGVAGQPDIRARDREFAARGGVSASDLKERLAGTVEATVAQVRAVTDERLAETIRPQGYEISVLAAIYHVVEHFSYHTGQILWITKAALDEDLGYYGHLSRPGSHTAATP